jgi:hypothetical protein
MLFTAFKGGVDWEDAEAALLRYLESCGEVELGGYQRFGRCYRCMPHVGSTIQRDQRGARLCLGWKPSRSGMAT